MLQLCNHLIQPAREYVSNNEKLIAPEALHSFLAATTTSSLLLVTTSSRKAEEISKELASWIGSNKVVNFPAWETLPHE